MLIKHHWGHNCNVGLPVGTFVNFNRMQKNAELELCKSVNETSIDCQRG